MVISSLKANQLAYAIISFILPLFREFFQQKPASQERVLLDWIGPRISTALSPLLNIGNN